MIKWEYQVIYQTGTFKILWEGENISLQAFLNKKGWDGWELVQGPTHLYPQCIFKRSLP